MDHISNVIAGFVAWATDNIVLYAILVVVVSFLLFGTARWHADRGESKRRRIKNERRCAKTRRVAARRQAELEREQARDRLAQRLRASKQSADDIADAAEIFAREYVAAKARERQGGPGE